MTDDDLRFLRLLIRARAGKMVHVLAGEMTMSEASVRARASRLRDLGMVRSSRSGGYVFYELTALGQKEAARSMRAEKAR